MGTPRYAPMSLAQRYSPRLATKSAVAWPVRRAASISSRAGPMWAAASPSSRSMDRYRSRIREKGAEKSCRSLARAAVR